MGMPIQIMKRFEAEGTLKRIEEHGITHVVMAPIMLSRLLQLPEEVRRSYDVSSVRMIAHLGAPPPSSVKKAVIDWLGPVLHEAYGASEFGTVTRISSQEWLAKPGSAGKPIDAVRVEILVDGRPAATGEVGPIYVTRLADLDLEYVGDPEKTAQARPGERRFTFSDLGWLGDDGHLFLSDRRSDMIYSGGSNIYPAEIESVLMEHPSVADVGVSGVPNEEWGQEVKAIIQLRDGFEPSEELVSATIAWLRQRVAGPNGKVHRRELRDPQWAQPELVS